MKKAILPLLISILAIFSSIFFLTACGNGGAVKNRIIFETFAVDGTNAYCKVSNATTSFDFSEEILVKGEATFIIDDDKDCSSPLTTSVVELVEGDNVFYVLEKFEDNSRLFTVTIRRRLMYTVTFNANGDNSSISITEIGDSINGH